MLQTILSKEIQDLIEQHNWQQLAKTRYAWPDPEIVAPEIVDVLIDLDPPDRALFFRALPRDLAVEVFSYLDPEHADELLVDLTDTETRRLISEMSPDDRTALLEELPGQVTQRLLNMLPGEDLREARKLLGYPEESVGRLMTPDYIKVRREWTVGQALDHIRKIGEEDDELSVIYVTNARGRLVDAIPLTQLVLADPEQPLTDIMDYSFVCLSATDDQEEAVRVMHRYNRLMLPVIDTSGILLGVVTIDSVMDVSEEEVTEDFHLSAAVTPLRTGYWDTSAFSLVRSRIGWLAVLVVVNLLSSGVIAAFEETLEAVVVLAFFIPLIIDTGGNAGSQSATLMIRAMSIGDVKMEQWLRVFLKELLIGISIGVVLGAMGFGLGLWRGGAEIGLVVFLTMVTMLVITNLFGMLLPFLLARVNADPAIASGPLVTSLADAAGLLIYFSYAVMVLF